MFGFLIAWKYTFPCGSITSTKAAGNSFPLRIIRKKILVCWICLSWQITLQIIDLKFYFSMYLATVNLKNQIKKKLRNFCRLFNYVVCFFFWMGSAVSSWLVSIELAVTAVNFWMLSTFTSLSAFTSLLFFSSTLYEWFLNSSQNVQVFSVLSYQKEVTFVLQVYLWPISSSQSTTGFSEMSVLCLPSLSKAVKWVFRETFHKTESASAILRCD